MAAFTTFGNILPNPSVKITYAGEQNASGNAGAGYASVKLEGEYKTAMDVTNSGRLVSRANAAHSWKIDITYNPMTRTEFSPVYSFLLEKQGRLKPFYVTLPQHEASQNSSFSSTLAFTANTGTGVTWIEVDGYSTNPPRPGDLFTITDASNTNHNKAYMITRVEDSANYNSVIGGLAANELRLHITPQLQRYTYNNATLNLGQSAGTIPAIKVIATDLVSYQLKTDNLYVFTLSLEEVQ